MSNVHTIAEFRRDEPQQLLVARLEQASRIMETTRTTQERLETAIAASEASREERARQNPGAGISQRIATLTEEVEKQTSDLKQLEGKVTQLEVEMGALAQMRVFLISQIGRFYMRLFLPSS